MLKRVPPNYRLRLRVERMLETIGVTAERLKLYGLAAWLARPLLIAEELCRQPFIVVLSEGIRSTGQLSEASRVRVGHGVRLLNASLAPYLILSGGRRAAHRPSSSPRMKALAEALGVRSDRIILEERSSRTAENAREVSKILHAHGASSILLVTSPLHMLRAKRCFEKRGVRVFPGPAYELSPEAFHGRPRLFKEVLHEYLALAYYWTRGWI